MTFTITNENTGRQHSFVSEDAYEVANWWYNNTSKARIVDFCRSHGIELEQATDDPAFSGRRLIEGWEDCAMELFAKVSE